MNFTDPFDHYQYLTFKWVLFIIFMVSAFEVLDHHIHLKVHIKTLLEWLKKK